MIHVLLDTNAIDLNRPLTTTAGEALMEAAHSGKVQLVVPELVIAELVNRWREECSRAATERDAAAHKLVALGATDRRRIPRPIDVEAAAAAFEQGFRRELQAAGAEMPPLPDVPHGDIVDRALRRDQPFDVKGHDGYRDVLLWETVLEQTAAGHDVALVSSDMRAFYESRQDKRLSDALEWEVMRRCGRQAVTMYWGLPELGAAVLEENNEADAAFWKMIDDDDFVDDFWSRLDRAIEGLPVPPSSLPLADVTSVADAEVGATLDEGGIIAVFVRVPDVSRPNILLLDLSILAEVTVRASFPASDYEVVASTIGHVSAVGADDETATIDMHGWVTVECDAEVDAQAFTLLSARATRITGFSETRS
jgi:hypothetical protein